MMFAAIPTFVRDSPRQNGFFVSCRYGVEPCWTAGSAGSIKSIIGNHVQLRLILLDQHWLNPWAACLGFRLQKWDPLRKIDGQRRLPQLQINSGVRHPPTTSRRAGRPSSHHTEWHFNHPAGAPKLAFFEAATTKFDGYPLRWRRTAIQHGGY